MSDGKPTGSPALLNGTILPFFAVSEISAGWPNRPSMQLAYREHPIATILMSRCPDRKA